MALILDMTEPQLISWIFLSTSLASKRVPASQKEVSDIADGINCSIPVSDEIQASLDWLINNKMVIRTDDKYFITGAGKSLISSAESNQNSLIDIWMYLEKEVERLMKG